MHISISTDILVSEQTVKLSKLCISQTFCMRKSFKVAFFNQIAGNISSSSCFFIKFQYGGVVKLFGLRVYIQQACRKISDVRAKMLIS